MKNSMLQGIPTGKAEDALIRKPCYSLTPKARDYLRQYDRLLEIPISYEDLLGFTASFPVEDDEGRDTLWRTVVYDPTHMRFLNDQLSHIYAALRTGGDFSVMEHLSVDHIDYCAFGNSHPFRVCIINHFNDNQDHFYVKRADASRIFGLELEHLLSPNRISFLVWEETLIEEHIAGVPGDMFFDRYLGRRDVNRVRIAKEFVKFSERCFVRLLGDMRCYNYVVDITPDFKDEQYRVRAIDFDQQTYEGSRRIYLAHNYENNQPMVELCRELLNPVTMRQYQMEERTLISRRYRASHERLQQLLACMKEIPGSSLENVRQLALELNEFHGTNKFTGATSMGEILDQHLEIALAHANRRWRLGQGLGTSLPANKG